MDYRIDKEAVLQAVGQWNRFLRKRVHLIACGGTALTLLDVKLSTKDIDFMVPLHAEHDYLLKTLSQLGYEQTTASGWQRRGDIFRFDLFRGNRIHTTELLESPLNAGKHTLLKEYSHLTIGILNAYDLIASKLIRGSGVDFEDCLLLVKAEGGIDTDQLRSHYAELISYDVSRDRIAAHMDRFLELLREEGLV